MKTSNPALSSKVFLENSAVSADNLMTVRGTVLKSLTLIAILMATGYYSWQAAFPGGWSEFTAPSIPAWYLPASIGGLILAFVIIFKQTWAPALAPVYAGLQGVVLGAISALFEYQYPGIVMNALLGTIGTFLSMLICYQSGLIQVTERFRFGVTAATGGIMVVYLIDMVLRFFGMNVPFIHESGLIGMGISLVVIGVAALNLVLDFDFIEQGAERGAAKYMEWYAAFGLLVTLIWLYLEMLRLLNRSKN